MSEDMRATQRKIGYAVPGPGIGMAHADAAYVSPNADLIAVCDIDKARPAKAAEAYPGVTFLPRPGRPFELRMHRRIEVRKKSGGYARLF